MFPTPISEREYITDVSTCALVQSCPTLKELILRGCNITDISMNGIINSCRNLRKLDIGFCEQISGNVIVAIKKAIPKIKLRPRFYARILSSITEYMDDVTEH